MSHHPFLEPLLTMAALDVLLVICAALIRLKVYPNKPLAFHALAVWAVLLLLADFASELGGAPGVVLLVIATGIGLLIAGCWWPWSQKIQAGGGDHWAEIATVLTALGLQVALFALPLAVFPSQTLITGYQVCNDAVTHSILMRGLSAVTGAFREWHWLGYYPSGFHSVVFALSPLFRFGDAPMFLLPAGMWGTSFVALAVLMLLHEDQHKGRILAVLIAASPAAAFLVATSVYLNFVGHIAAMPFLIGGVVVAASWTSNDLQDRGIILVFSIVAAAAATYGLVALTAIGLALALRLAWEYRRGTVVATMWREALRLGRARLILVAFAVILALSIPVATRIVRGYSFFVSETHTQGNLPDGFLTPFHVTGLWRGPVEYRSQLPGQQSYLGVILAAVLIGEVVLIAGAGLSRAAVISLVTLGIPVVVSAIVVRSPYVNFKYLCFFTALWVPIAMLGLSRWIQRITGRAALSALALCGTLVAMVGGPLGSFRELPSLPVHWFLEMAVMRDRHFSQGPVLVLSKEDWFHYYRDEDDIVPLTFMYPQTYRGQPLHEVLVDPLVQQDAESFLATHFPGTEKRLDVCPSDVVGARYKIYEMSCLMAVHP